MCLLKLCCWIHWVCQKVHLGFSLPAYGKSQTNFFGQPNILRSSWQEYCERNLYLPRIVVIEIVIFFSASHWQFGVCCTFDYRNNLGLGGVVIAWTCDPDDNQHHCWECCHKFSHVQTWMFIGLPGIWWSSFIHLLVWFLLSPKPNPSREDSWYA